MARDYIAGVTHDNKKIFYSEKKYKVFSTEKKKLIMEALPKIEYKREVTISFDRIVGETGLVELEEYQKENVIWCYRTVNDRWRVPVILNEKARKTTYMTICFRREKDKIFIVDCFFGKRALPIPEDPYACKCGPEFVQKCQSYWQKHALIVPLKDINVSKTIEMLNEKELERFNKIIGA